MKCITRKFNKSPYPQLIYLHPKQIRHLKLIKFNIAATRNKNQQIKLESFEFPDTIFDNPNKNF